MLVVFYVLELWTALRWLAVLSLRASGLPGVALYAHHFFFRFFSLDAFFQNLVMTSKKKNTSVELDPLPHWIAVSVMRLEMGVWLQKKDKNNKIYTKKIMCWEGGGGK